MAGNRDDDGSRGPRRICEPHDGSRTPSFLIFKRNFKTCMDSIFLHEDDYSLWQAVFGTDQGGDDANAPALPAQGQAGHLQAVPLVERHFRLVMYQLRTGPRTGPGVCVSRVVLRRDRMPDTARRSERSYPHFHLA